MGVLIQAEDVHKTYVVNRVRVPVLRGASLGVGEGEAIAVVGLSGAGKSTLLHILGGLDRPDSGRVIIPKGDLYGLSEKERARVRATEIGFVFQSYHLLP